MMMKGHCESNSSDTLTMRQEMEQQPPLYYYPPSPTRSSAETLSEIPPREQNVTVDGNNNDIIATAISTSGHPGPGNNNNNNSKPRHTTRRWSAEEDEQLTQLVANAPDFHKISWAEIASHMPNRSAKQCRERYINSLKPDSKKGLWTEEEDENIIRFQAVLGNQWSKIAASKFFVLFVFLSSVQVVWNVVCRPQQAPVSFITFMILIYSCCLLKNIICTTHTVLPGRSDNDVKNRWHSKMRSKAVKRKEREWRSSAINVSRGGVNSGNNNANYYNISSSNNSSGNVIHSAATATMQETKQSKPIPVGKLATEMDLNYTNCTANALPQGRAKSAFYGESVYGDDSQNAVFNGAWIFMFFSLELFAH